MCVLQIAVKASDETASLQRILKAGMLQWLEGDTQTINDGNQVGSYTVTNVRPDGTGITVFALEAQ